jgi:hypothetical protein
MVKSTSLKALRKRKQPKIKEVIQPDRSGEINDGRSCSLTYNPKTLRYDLFVGGVLVYSSVSHAACLQAAEVLRIVWEDEG